MKTTAILLATTLPFVVRAAASTSMSGNSSAETELAMSDNRVMPPPPDPDQAVREELWALKARGTVQAMDLFLSRHPDHPLTDEARRFRAYLLQKAEPSVPGRVGPEPPPRDLESTIREEFEALKARGTADAMDLFIARHPDHPLAAEALKIRDQLYAGTSED